MLSLFLFLDIHNFYRPWFEIEYTHFRNIKNLLLSCMGPKHNNDETEH